jgi:predicted Zn-dependent protease
MSTTLSLVAAAWDSIRAAAEQGRNSDALRQTRRLLSLPDLPTSIATQAHRLAAELSLEAESFTAARRHLRAAVALTPGCAYTAHLLGLAFERDPEGCDRRAALAFRRACKLDAANCLYRASYGRAAVRCGKVRLGRRELRSAAKAAPSDAAVLRVVIEGLLEAGAVRTADVVLSRAQFLLPTSRVLAGLRERVRFTEARLNQRDQGRTARRRQDAEHATDGGRAVLPFIRLVTSDTAPTSREVLVRHDVVSFPRPHFPRFRAQGRR